MSSASDVFHMPLRLRLTQSYPCSYLDGNMACSQTVLLPDSIEAPVYTRLIRKGFRRSGMHIYRPRCEGCHACLSLRIPVASFEPNRSQKRTMQKLQNLRVRVMELVFLPEHYDLYCRYQKSRHTAGGMDADSRQQYEQFLLRSSVKTCLVEFRDAGVSEQHLGALRMVAIIDVLRDGLSSVYTFYDPDNAQASYGTYGVLWQIEYARKLKLLHVYLGYWVSESPKMAYKIKFSPFELYTSAGWRFFNPSDK